MNICIIGAGAIGCFYGGKLAQAGARVSIVKRGALPEKITPISIESHYGDFSFIPSVYYSSLSEVLEAQTVDLIIVSAKTLPETNLVTLFHGLVPHCPVLLLQNGIHNEQLAQTALSGINLFGGLAFICVSRRPDGSIYHQDYGRLKIGDYSGNNAGIMASLKELWESVGVPVSLTDDVNKARWEKLVWNAPFNPMSVLNGGQSTADILKNPESRERVQCIMEEVVSLAAADGVQLPSDIIEKNIANTLNMTPYKTSMLLDYEAGRPLEIDAILGQAIRVAESNNVSVPNIRQLYDDVMQIVAANNPSVAL